jgi:hypothetical protein
VLVGMATHCATNGTERAAHYATNGIVRAIPSTQEPRSTWERMRTYSADRSTVRDLR